MTNAAMIQFSKGEITPKCDVRVDTEMYQGGCRKLDNMIPSIDGNAVRRPGLQFKYSVEPMNKQELYEYCYNPVTTNSRFTVAGTSFGCQTITPQTSHYITGFRTYWYRINSPTGSLFCRLETTVWDSDREWYEPSGTVLETSTTSFVNVSMPLGSPYKQCTFAFAGTTRLVAGTIYALVFYSNGGTPTNYVRSRGLNLSGVGTDGYTRGSSGKWDGTNWGYLLQEEDCWFEEYGQLTRYRTKL